jgi:hypothetical protein
MDLNPLSKRKDILFAVFFGVTLLWMGFVRHYYTSNRQVTIQPELGRTIPVKLDHNKTVYVTREDELWLDISFDAFACAGVLNVITLLMSVRKK